MAKENLGKKHSCPHCGTLFYDLRRKSIVCPKCGAGYVDPKTFKTKHIREKFAEEPVPTPVEQIVTVDDDEDTDLVGDDINVEVVDNDAEDNGLIEDASDLGVEDDMSDVKEHIDSDVADKG